MQAIILAAGVGSRMERLTAGKPKCLVKVGGTPILGHLLTGLKLLNPERVIITVGYREEQVRRYVSRFFPHLTVQYVRNPRFHVTNYIYSIWLARRAITSGPVLLLHGDVVFDYPQLHSLIQSNASNMLIKRIRPKIRKDAEVRIVHGRVTKIGVPLEGKAGYGVVPCYKFRWTDWLRFMGAVEQFVSEGNIKCHAEIALDTVLSKMVMHPVFVTHFAMEIDNAQELRAAERHFRNQRKE